MKRINPKLVVLSMVLGMPLPSALAEGGATEDAIAEKTETVQEPTTQTAETAAPAETSTTMEPPATGVDEVVIEASTLPERFIAGGQRVQVSDKGISIVPPQGWEVHSNVSGSTLLMQVPKQPGMLYQRTIQVMAFGEPMPMDQMTENEFANKIVSNFGSQGSMASNYEIRNRQAIQMDDGTKGILFYASFNMGDVPMMQMHVLLSSRERHYVMTYTDLAEHFDSDKNSGFLDAAYASLISTRLMSTPPARFESTVTIFVGVGLLIVLLASIRLLQVMRARRFREDEERDGVVTKSRGEADGLTMSSVEPISQVDDTPLSQIDDAPLSQVKGAPLSAVSSPELAVKPNNVKTLKSKTTVTEESKKFKSSISVLVAEDQYETEMGEGDDNLDGDAFEDGDDQPISDVSANPVMVKKHRQAS